MRLTLNTDFGLLQIVEQDGWITNLSIVSSVASGLENAPQTPVLEQAARQLQSYLSGDRKTFDLPLRPAGTAFQKQVWQAVAQIPYGQTASYCDICQAIGRPTAFRAVGAAIGKNPLWIVVPCHRVVGQSGALTGYAGGLTMKASLLELERRFR